MNELLHFIAEHFTLFWWGAVLWVFLSFTAIHLWNRARGRYFVDPPRERRLHDELFASGRSLRNWSTRMGRANNCLRIMLTTERLYVRPLFPFLILGPRLDLVHSIPLEAITTVTHERKMFGRIVLIGFRSSAAVERTIELWPKQHREFWTALSVAMEARNPAVTAAMPPPLPQAAN